MHSQLPDTRPSILLRVCESGDEEAWSIFASIYGPAIYRIARSKGLQDADAHDVCQAVLSKLAHRSWSFSPTDERAKFRTWLAKVTQNAIIDHHRGHRSMTELQPTLDQPIIQESIESILELEYRREVFQWAAKIIRSEFCAETWRAFWLTAVEHQPVSEVARQLGRSVGSIYTCRSRVMQRLRSQVLRFDGSLGDEL